MVMGTKGQPGDEGPQAFLLLVMQGNFPTLLQKSWCICLLGLSGTNFSPDLSAPGILL